MAALLITSAVAGIILGLRFKVLVLIPASVLVAVIVMSQGGQKLHTVLLTLVAAVASLQIGYVAGSILRYLARVYLPAWTRRSGTKRPD